MKTCSSFFISALAFSATALTFTLGGLQVASAAPDIRVGVLVKPPALQHESDAAHIATMAAAAKIDQLVEKKLVEQKLKPNPLSTDEVFVRRVYLDVIGRVPTAHETLDFLTSSETDKRAKLIDHLLASDGYTQNYFHFWADLLRLKTTTIGGAQTLPAGLAYTRWLKQALHSNKRYDVMVRELLTAKGKTYENGAVGFYIRDYNMPLDNMAVTTQIFLGTQIVCAQCHNHPFDKWTQMDYYQIAAHSYGMTGTNALLNPEFNKAVYGSRKKAEKTAGTTDQAPPLLLKGEDRKQVTKAIVEIMRPLRYNTVTLYDKKPLQLPHDYKYADGKPLQTIEPVIPASMGKEGKISKDGILPIEAYARWMTSPENPRFTTVVANRLWKKLFGLGVIEPVDQMTDSTVASNPALMDCLESTMKQNGYNLKVYLRVLLNTSTYQRAAYTKDVDLGETYYFPGPLLRRLSAEQVWDSLVALYKPSPDHPSKAMELETDEQLTRIEWWDRALNNENTEELLGGARKIAEVQGQLSEQVRKAQTDLKEAQAKHDEAAIRQARRVSAEQRKNIDEAVERIVYEVGFEKFVAMARKNELKEQVDNPAFAKEISAAIQKKADSGEKMTLEDALQLLLSQKKKAYQDALKAKREHDLQAFKVQGKAEHSLLLTYESAAENTAVRAADLRSPAPNGHFLRVFGQSDRELVGNSNEDASVMQSLMMLNGKYFKTLLNPFTVVSRQLKNAHTPEEAIDTIYLSLMSRHATAEEQKLLRPLVKAPAGPTTPANAMEVYAPALWAVLNTRQFLFVE